ncbi:MAG: UDP-N-acetylmuramate dehydrogenase [Ignavibacteriales bacterium]|nr:UDP-N-acetylmuramate dehydrogenase [Ignavibacteriales bacterium]
MIIQEDFSLKQLNTLGVDAKAKHFIELEDENDLLEYLDSKEAPKRNPMILGGGSNVLFTKNYDGTILRYPAKGIKIIEENSSYVFVESSAGELWDDLVTFCIEKNFYGIENLSLIPGEVGAAPIQNIGAYGVELKDVFDNLEGYFLDTKEKRKFSKTDCRFGYRDSIFKKELKNKFLITKVVLRLSKEKKFNLSYKALQEQLGDINPDKLTIYEVAATVREIRESKLPDPKKIGNAGSFFKNPEIGSTQLAQIQKKYPDITFYKTGDDSFKIPAGWLIEKCGYKGKRIGNIGCYEKQALVIVNYGNAGGEEIRAFAEKIRNAVNYGFNIKLDYEVSII